MKIHRKGAIHARRIRTPSFAAKSSASKADFEELYSGPHWISLKN
jgi:hypothetical protein